MSFVDLETTKTRSVERDMRREVAHLTGLGVQSPTRRDVERWGAPPHDARVYGPEVRPSGLLRCSAILELKDRTNYSPLSQGWDVFFPVGKFAAIVELGLEEDLPVYFVVLDAPGSYYFARIYTGAEQFWKKQPQPRQEAVYQNELADKEVYLIPAADFEPLGFLRQDIRDSSRD